MSIFEVKEWWSTNISKDEEFDGNSVCIDNIDNENLNKNKICVSSFKGILRIYEPTFGSTRVDNLLFEKQLDMPIIQIGSGNFVINANDKQLAVLQAKKLIVYQFYNLRTGVSTKTCYEHKLVRNAFNFCIGRIGEKNYDFIFVQSVDGVISIFEQDAIVNHVSLNEVIFPGPIGFLSRKDHLLVSNTAYEVECYSYNNLATTNSKSEGKIMYTWSYNLGELVREIKTIDNKITKKQEIMIITETMLHLLEDNGKILFQKKLDFEPMSVYVYNIEDSNYSANKNINLMYAISTDSDHILVYKGLNLVWAAKVHDTPVFLKLADFDGTKGLLTTLSDTGSLNVMYLGMTPAKNSKMYIPGKTLDIDNVVKETDRLSEIIENYERGVVIIPKDTLTLTADINRELCADDYYFEDKIYHCDTLGKILRSQVKLTFAFDGLEAENIKITIITPYNVVCDDHSFTIERLTSHNSPFSRIINFRVLNQYFPTYTNVKVYATYFIKNSDKVADKSLQSTVLDFELPLNLFLRTAPPSKEAKYKITLCTDKEVLTIPEIFNDLTEYFPDREVVKSNPNIIGFNYPNKSEVTIIISKNGGRYRIQSSNYEALLFMTHQIVLRLSEHFNYDINFFIEDDLIYTDYLNLVENHFKLFSSKKDMNDELENYTGLYTIIQKNLLSKYKEKNPPSLNNLDFLQKQVYKSINKNTDDILKSSNELKLLTRQLTVFTETMLYLLKLRSKCNEDNYQVLKDAFPLENILTNTENSWHDITFTNMTNIFKYYFSNEKENLQEIKDNKDIEKWKKYFLTLCDKIIKNNGF